MEKKMMKAVYMPNRETFGLYDLPIPTPKYGEVLIKVGACGICHTDIRIRAGIATNVCYPFTPGHEFAGTIVEVGPGVDTVKVGDRGVVQQVRPDENCRAFKLRNTLGSMPNKEFGLHLNGGMAEYCVLPVNQFLPIPDSVSFSEAAFVEPLANAGSAMYAAHINFMDTVVVIGPGPIGIAACKIATFYGAGKVVLVGTRDYRLQVAKENDFGIDEVVNIRKPGAEEYLMNEVLEGRGADAIVDCSGALSGFELAMKICADSGRIVCEGSMGPDDYYKFNSGKLQPSRGVSTVSGWRSIDFYNALQFISSGKVNVKPLVTQELPLIEWEKGFELATTGKDTALKVMLCNE